MSIRVEFYAVRDGREQYTGFAVVRALTDVPPFARERAKTYRAAVRAKRDGKVIGTASKPARGRSYWRGAK